VSIWLITKKLPSKTSGSEGVEGSAGVEGLVDSALDAVGLVVDVVVSSFAQAHRLNTMANTRSRTMLFFIVIVPFVIGEKLYNTDRTLTSRLRYRQNYILLIIK
jgi:hypothetical protein